MTDAETFLKAIHDNPADDTVRLVYADWLDEHADAEGRARAELIRTQITLEQLPPGDPQRVKFGRKAQRILKPYYAAWVAPLKDANLGAKWEFRRGFVEGITISATKFGRVAGQLFFLAPTIRAVRFPDASNEVRHLLNSSYLDRLTEIDLTRMCMCGHCPIEAELRRLFGSKKLTNLTVLRVGRDRIDPGLAETLAKSKHLKNLRTLDLSGNPLGPDGVRAIANSKHLAGLTTLDLSLCRLGNDGAAALAASPYLRNLSVLKLTGNAIRAGGAKALADSPVLTSAIALDLSHNSIGPTGAKSLATNENIARLQTLDCTSAGVGPKGSDTLRRWFGKRVKL